MASELPLSDVKVLDFSWAMAAPAATRVLADYGATVVRVESSRRFDVMRTVGPFLTLPPGTEGSAGFQNLNAGKLMLALDLGKESARRVIFDLVRWSDVVLESFMAGTMRRWGLDYEALRKVNPQLVMVSSCLMGQSGPLAGFAGFGNLASAISGFHNLTGWPDRAPAGPFGAYTDYLSPRFTVAVILAALDHRRRTGEGLYVDQSQGEASLHFLAPALLDYTANGRVQERAGNRDLDMAPHGVYAAAGEDRWVAVVARDDGDWKKICAALGRADLAADERFRTTEARLANQEALDRLIGAWTAERDALEIERELVTRGVPAAVVRNSAELVEDAQLRHREHFVELPHPEHGKTMIEGSRFRLSRTPAAVGGTAPTLGRDNERVFREILGYDDERITELIVDGAVE